MAYVNLTKDFSEVKKTVAGTGLTKRQILGLFLGIVLGLPIFFLFKYPIQAETTTSVFAMGLIIIPVFLLVTYKKDGLYMEKHIRYFFETHFIRNTDRPDKTDNLYEMIRKEEELKRITEKILFRGKSKMEIQNILESGKTQEFKVGKQKIRIPLVGKLDRKTKRELERMVKKAKLKGEIPESAQDTIPYRVPYEDGIFESDNGLYNMTISFEDINYELLDNDPKNTLFGWWCKLINSFDFEIPFQFNYGNMEIDSSTYTKEIELKPQNDGRDRIRKEYSNMLIEQFSKSTNNLKKVRYLTYGVYAKDYESAKIKLGKVTKHIQKHLRRLQSKNHVLNGYERLELLYRLFHPASTEPLLWNWDIPIKSGMTSKDFIVPSSFSFKNSLDLNATKYFRVGDRIGAVSYLKILASDMEDRVINDMLTHNGNLWISIHGRALTRPDALRTAREALSNVQQQIIHQQKDASYGGYSMDIFSPELSVYRDVGENVYHSLQTKDEQMYNFVITVVQTANTRKELEAAIYDLKESLKDYSTMLIRLDNRQEQGYVSSLPLCVNKLEVLRTFITTDMAIFIPFTTKELYAPTGQYYGMNSLSNNVIMVDKKKLVNPNGIVLGAPGYGKSFATKREAMDVYLRTDDDILIIDPEGEYGDLVKALGGQYIKISLNSEVHINPMEIELSALNNKDSEYDPIASKCGFVESMCELILGVNSVLSKKQLATIDRCCNKIYYAYKENPDPARMPTLGDLYHELRNMGEEDLMAAIGIDLSIGLTRYVDGSLSYFNNQSNVDINSRIVCFDLKDMDAGQKDLTMLIIQELIWARVAKNRSIGKFTRVYIDEFHLLLRNPKTAAYCVEIWKRFRKWGGIPTGITQNIKDLFRSPEIQNILDTTNFIMMLNQNGDDARLLAEHLEISDEEMMYIKSGEPGKGLLWVEEVKVPFEDEFPKNTLCYKLMTTKPDENIEEGLIAL